MLVFTTNPALNRHASAGVLSAHSLPEPCPQPCKSSHRLALSTHMLVFLCVLLLLFSLRGAVVVAAKCAPVPPTSLLFGSVWDGVSLWEGKGGWGLGACPCPLPAAFYQSLACRLLLGQ